MTRVFLVTSRGLEEDLQVKVPKLQEGMRIEVSGNMDVSFSSLTNILTVGRQAEALPLVQALQGS